MNWCEPEFAAIAHLLTRECGIAFPPGRRSFAEAAIGRAMVRARERDPAAYRMRLAADPALLRALIAEATVGETYFFRDPGLFEVLRTAVLPALAQRRSADAPLRVWSAGCSTGEEAYSLAIVLDEFGLASRTTLLATDVSPKAIEAAQRGSYGEWSFRFGSEGLRERFFASTGKRWTIAENFRFVDFQVRNVLQPLPVWERFDLILCRNVLLYFDEEHVARAAGALAAALAPGGWLFTSPTDPPLRTEAGLESVVTPAGIALHRPLNPQTAVAAAHAPAPARPHTARLASRTAPRTAAPAAPPQRAPRPLPDAEAYLARALISLDSSEPQQAAAQARRALFLDRSLAVAHLTLARALRLTGHHLAAQRSLLRGAALLDAQSPAEAERGAGGATAETLCAVAVAEFDLLLRRPS